jgi:hypothetical protein
VNTTQFQITLLSGFHRLIHQYGHPQIEIHNHALIVGEIYNLTSDVELNHLLDNDPSSKTLLNQASITFSHTPFASQIAWFVV